MALNAIQGTMGAGKTYYAANRLLPDILRDSNRPIYTNLPLEVDQLLLRVSRNAAKRDEYRRRVHFIEDRNSIVWEHKETKVLAYDQLPEGATESDWEIISDGEGFNRLTEFWYFCEPNAVVVLDEVADIYNSREYKDRPKSLQSFINHHRHYKMDLYFFMQDKEDVDVQIRRKILYVYDVQNSKYMNMFGWWALRGLKWPMQFFWVRVYLGKQVFGKSGDLTRYEPQQSFVVWPTRAGFKTYQSFSSANKLRGMKQADESAKSGDLEPAGKRLAGWLAHAGIPLSLLGAAIVAVYMFIQFVYWLAGGMNSGNVAHALGVSKGTTNAPQAVATPAQTKSTNETKSAEGKFMVANEVEKVVLVAPGRIVTTKRRLEIGSELNGKIVAGITARYILFGDGSKRSVRAIFP